MTETGRPPRRPTMLIILDGYGVNPSSLNNGIHAAKTPRLDHYFAHYPHTVLKASGRAVGLPEGQMGNSEVGHMSLGSGTVIRQDLVRINDSIDDGSFYQNPALLAAVNKAADQNKPLHLLGLVSTGGVHSHLRHLLALIELCRQHAVSPWVHMITDGRDTAPRSALNYLPVLQKALDTTDGRIATVCGRFYAMDRDNRWDRIERAWRLIIQGVGAQADSAHEAISASYAQGKDDEFIQPVAVAGYSGLQNDEPLVFFNFRNDRPRQLTEALSKSGFNEFERDSDLLVPVTCLTVYSKRFKLPVAFESERPLSTLGQVVSQHGLQQFHCAETEKYAHVTFFFNGGREVPYSGEVREMVPSPRVATYDLAPEMSAAGVADACIQAVNSGKYALMVVNFANGDMVGHTAIAPAIIKALEVMDHEVGRLLDAAVTAGYSVLLTSDHGNCDEMVDAATGEPHTQHTVYPVPCLVIDNEQWRLSIGAGLSSVTPTVLQMMGLEKDSAMTGESLLHQSLTDLDALL